MDPNVAILVGFVLTLALGYYTAILVTKRSPSVVTPSDVTPSVVPGSADSAASPGSSLDEVRSVPAEAESWFTTSDAVALSAGDLVIAENPDDASTVLVIGDEQKARSLGEPVGFVPQQLVRAMIGVDAALNLAVSLGEAGGVLVRLTPESARMLREAGWARDASGVAMGVLRGSSGQFAHILRFSPATGLVALGGVTGLFSALAMQAQLSAIQDSLADLTRDVQRVEGLIQSEATAESVAVAELLDQVFRAASTAGVLTDTMWSELAPIAWIVRKHEEYADLRLKGLIAELAGAGDVGSKRKWLKQRGSELSDAYEGVERQSRVSAQMASLRLWRLMLVEDPSTPFYLADLRASTPNRSETIRQLVDEVDKVLAHASTTRQRDRVMSPFDSRDVTKLSRDVRERFGDARAKGMLEYSGRVALQGAGPGPSRTTAEPYSPRDDDQNPLPVV